MKTLFEALNESSLNLDWRDIHINHEKIENILIEYPNYVKRYYPGLKLFSDSSYWSKRFDALEKENIDIDLYKGILYSNRNIVLEKDPTKLVNMFGESVHKFLYDHKDDIINIIDKSKFKSVPEKIFNKVVDDYIENHICDLQFYLYFINKDRKTGKYVLCHCNGNKFIGAQFYSYVFRGENYKYGEKNDNSFGIKYDDIASKEDLIEYGKLICNIDYIVMVYSMYFDNL